jgi:hypothetical protein
MPCTNCHSESAPKKMLSTIPHVNVPTIEKQRLEGSKFCGKSCMRAYLRKHCPTTHKSLLRIDDSNRYRSDAVMRESRRVAAIYAAIRLKEIKDKSDFLEKWTPEAFRTFVDEYHRQITMFGKTAPYHTCQLIGMGLDPESLQNYVHREMTRPCVHPPTQTTIREMNMNVHFMSIFAEKFARFSNPEDSQLTFRCLPDDGTVLTRRTFSREIVAIEFESSSGKIRHLRVWKQGFRDDYFMETTDVSRYGLERHVLNKSVLLASLRKLKSSCEVDIVKHVCMGDFHILNWMGVRHIFKQLERKEE